MSEALITVLDQLDQLEEIVLDGFRIPLSGRRLVDFHEADETIDTLRKALPLQLEQASDLLGRRDGFIEQARQQAKEILEQAQRERQNLIASASVLQEAERQGAELREQARQQSEQVIVAARQKAAQAEQELQARVAQLDQQFAARRQQLEQEAQARFHHLEQQESERKRLLEEQHQRALQQANGELAAIRQEGMRIQRDSEAEATRLRNDALQFHQQTQQQCEALVARARQEASGVQEGANHYAEQVLGELEGRLKELSQVVLGGRRELVRLQSVESQAPVRGGDLAVVAESEPASRARRAAGRLRRAATRGIAS
jgi:DNA repair exonuclease SbcCD ATPase subunit